jgi:predicted nuclease of predicted toxin-antitoxin system
MAHGPGHVAQHVADHNLEAASDAAIWNFALGASAAIITKDEDFALRKASGDSARR